ncbi:tetratricopeptide repeat protein [Streptomyces sp. NBC_01294]|uniref:tetratricopeptide repeat protein n=1 Tax=Streptomyces sp. NBC_01294 TaxID=2903815 RepID=UPI002DDA7FD5|nr:tetratricopeptide repeat protein [Streptomyces sp. NBC_01294]WRZ60279.1 tetratricopeptide repeat protein [Streptomyces sp. NBC_01294]
MGKSDPHDEQMLAVTKAVADKWTGVGEPVKEAAARTELGRILFQMGQGKEALAELRRAAKLFEDNGAGPPAAHALLGCAHALTIQDRQEESLEWFERAIKLFKEVDSVPGELEASAAKLEALGDLERWDETHLSDRIMSCTDDVVDPQLRVLRIVALKYRSQARLAARDVGGAVAPAMEAADVAHNVGIGSEEAALRLFAAHGYQLLHKSAQAVEQYKQVIDITRNLSGAAHMKELAVRGLGEALRA